MKILVTGKTGQLAKSIYALISSSDQKHKFAFIGREELDLNQNKSLIFNSTLSSISRFFLSCIWH